MRTKAGDRFTICVADGVVLMEARNVRCGDVWDCYHVDTGGQYADEYGSHMVFTDAEVAQRAANHRRRSG
jgi:hypothetical protein